MQRARAERVSQPVRHLFVVPGSCGPSIITALQRCNQALTRLTFFTQLAPQHTCTHARAHAVLSFAFVTEIRCILPPTGFTSSLPTHDTNFFFFSFFEEYLLQRKKNIKQTDKKVFSTVLLLVSLDTSDFLSGERVAMFSRFQ